MRGSRALLASFLAACGWLAVPSAHADDVMASMSLTGITIELIDLDPTDQYTPTLFFPPSEFQNTIVRAFAAHSSGQESETKTDPLPFATLSAEARSPVSFAMAQSGATSLFANAGSLHSTVSGAFADASTRAGLAFGPPETNALVLSPNTRLRVTAQALGEAAVDPTSCEANVCEAFVFAAVGLSWLDGNGTWQSLADDFRLSVSNVGTNPRQAREFDDLMVSFDNAGPVPGYAFVAVGASLSADARSILVVPEPQTHALVLAGLAAIAAVVRHRRLTQSSTARDSR